MLRSQTQPATATLSSTWFLTDTTETGWLGRSSRTRWRCSSEPTHSPASSPGRELRPCTRVRLRVFKKGSFHVCDEKQPVIQPPSPVCRFLELRGRRPAFCVPGCDHRRPLLLLLLLPAQHSGSLCGDGRQQPQEKSVVGYRESAAVRGRGGRTGGGPERWCHKASG